MARQRGTWVEALFDLLVADGERAAADVLRAALGPSPDWPVPLVEAEPTPEEALAYARALAEWGREEDAREVFAEVVRHAAGERPALAPPLPEAVRAAA
jgi:hypothetical protein